MKILSLTAENVKRLSIVEINADGNVITIGGKNGAGKSSVIDSIAYALGGMELVPDEPIARGKSGARIMIQLVDDDNPDASLTITREFWYKKEMVQSKLIVTGADGSNFRSPQGILNALMGRLSFDPLEFATMKRLEQAATLREVAGIDTTMMDAKRQGAFDRRTRLNRELKKLKPQAEALEFHEDAPDAAVDLAEFSKRFSEAVEEHKKFDEAHRFINERERVLRQAIDSVMEVEKTLERAREIQRDAAEEVKKAKETAKAMTIPPNLSEVEKDLRNADLGNRKFSANQKRKEAEGIVATLEEDVKKETDIIEALDLEKRQMVTNAKYPIDGLRVTEDGVYFNDLPFNQLSSAEQLRVSVAMGVALNPRLRVMLIRDGSLLDQESMRLLAEHAAEVDAQLWVERVTEDGNDVAVFIEDGHVGTA